MKTVPEMGSSAEAAVQKMPPIAWIRSKMEYVVVWEVAYMHEARKPLKRGIIYRCCHTHCIRCRYAA